MSPELRFVAQLARLSRALEQAADVAADLEIEGHDDFGELEYQAEVVRAYARDVLERVAERGSAKSAS